MDRPPPLFERWDKTPFWSSPLGIMLACVYAVGMFIALVAYLFYAS